MAQLLLVLFILPIGQAQEPDTLDLNYFFGQLTDLDALPVLDRGVSAAQASSYDRRSRFDASDGKYLDWNANNDRGHYLRIIEETGEAVMADLEGPGCINRIWSANPTGLIRFYIDGAEKPLEFSFLDLFTGKVHPFVPPLVWNRRAMMGDDNPASFSYFPIPYAKSCRVTADKAHNQYYHIGYTTFPMRTEIKSFALPMGPEAEAALDRTRALLTNLGEDPQPAELLEAAGRQEVAPGEEVPFATLEGPATIHQLLLRAEGEARFLHRKLILKVYWDDRPKAAILAPLGDFFGQSFGVSDYRSLPLGYREGEGYCYFRMPFNRSARLAVQNLSTRPAAVNFTVRYRSAAAQPDSFAYFRAGWRRERRCLTFDYPVLDCRGRGKFVGMALFIDNVLGGWWGEGDEKVYVDGAGFPVFFGTGSEDYFGDAWGIRQFVTPFCGCPLTVDAKQSCFRWHIPDAIPFDTQFLFTIENYSFDKGPPNDYATLAYWYQRPAGSDFFEPLTALDVRPRVPSLVEGAREAESIYEAGKVPAGARVIFDDDLPYDLSGGAGLELPVNPGAILYCPVRVPRRDLYEIELVTAPVEGAPRLFFYLNDQRIKDRAVLDGGTVMMHLEVRGGGKAGVPLILDYLKLTAVKKFCHRWAVLGPFDNRENTGLATPYPPEDEENPNPTGTYAGKDGVEISWAPVDADARGVVDLAPRIKPNQWGVAYAFATVTSKRALETDLYVGSDDGIKIWINGEVVHDHRVDRSLVIDEDQVAVKLKAGVNRLLVKVDQGEGGWGFTLRFRDEKNALTYGLEGMDGLGSAPSDQ